MIYGLKDENQVKEEVAAGKRMRLLYFPPKRKEWKKYGQLGHQHTGAMKIAAVWIIINPAENSFQPQWREFSWGLAACHYYWYGKKGLCNFSVGATSPVLQQYRSESRIWDTRITHKPSSSQRAQADFVFTEVQMRSKTSHSWKILIFGKNSRFDRLAWSVLTRYEQVRPILKHFIRLLDTLRYIVLLDWRAVLKIPLFTICCLSH